MGLVKRASALATAGPRAAPAARARPGMPTDGAPRGGAIETPKRTPHPRNSIENARLDNVALGDDGARADVEAHRGATAFWAHAARRQNAHSSTTREATPANPGRPGQPVAMVRSPAGRLKHRPSIVPAALYQRRRAPASQAGLTGRSSAALNEGLAASKAGASRD